MRVVLAKESVAVLLKWPEKMGAKIVFESMYSPAARITIDRF